MSFKKAINLNKINKPGKNRDENGEHVRDTIRELVTRLSMQNCDKMILEISIFILVNIGNDKSLLSKYESE